MGILDYVQSRAKTPDQVMATDAPTRKKFATKRQNLIAIGAVIAVGGALMWGQAPLHPFQHTNPTKQVQQAPQMSKNFNDTVVTFWKNSVGTLAYETEREPSHVSDFLSFKPEVTRDMAEIAAECNADPEVVAKVNDTSSRLAYALFNQGYSIKELGKGVPFADASGNFGVMLDAPNNEHTFVVFANGQVEEESVGLKGASVSELQNSGKNLLAWRFEGPSI